MQLSEDVKYKLIGFDYKIISAKNFPSSKIRRLTKEEYLNSKLNLVSDDFLFECYMIRSYYTFVMYCDAYDNTFKIDGWNKGFIGYDTFNDLYENYYMEQRCDFNHESCNYHFCIIDMPDKEFLKLKLSV